MEEAPSQAVVRIGHDDPSGRKPARDGVDGGCDDPPPVSKASALRSRTFADTCDTDTERELVRSTD